MFSGLDGCWTVFFGHLCSHSRAKSNPNFKKSKYRKDLSFFGNGTPNFDPKSWNHGLDSKLSLVRSDLLGSDLESKSHASTVGHLFLFFLEKLIAIAIVV